MTKIRPLVIRRVDWFRLMVELKRAGWSLRAMSAATGISKPVLVGLRNSGSEPKHKAGETLVALWCQATGLTREALPMESDEYKPRRVMPTADWEGGQISCPLCGTEHNVRPFKDAMPEAPSCAPDNRQMTLLV